MIERRLQDRGELGGVDRAPGDQDVGAQRKDRGQHARHAVRVEAVVGEPDDFDPERAEDRLRSAPHGEVVGYCVPVEIYGGQLLLADRLSLVRGYLHLGVPDRIERIGCAEHCRRRLETILRDGIQQPRTAGRLGDGPVVEGGGIVGATSR